MQHGLDIGSTKVGLLMEEYDLSSYGITVPNTIRNLNPAKLYEEALRYEPKTTISSAGALIAYSGAKTGRSPKDKRIVKHPASEKKYLVGAGQCSD